MAAWFAGTPGFRYAARKEVANPLRDSSRIGLATRRALAANEEADSQRGGACEWPPGSGSFATYPQSGKRRGEGDRWPGLKLTQYPTRGRSGLT